MSYKIELVPSGVEGARPTMYRGGLKFNTGEPQVLNLTKEELEVFENDWRFKVSDSRDPGSTIEEAKAAIGDTIPSAVDIAGEEKPVPQIEAIEDQLATQEEEMDDKGQEPVVLATLLKTHSREELNDEAAFLGVENPELFANKTEVAQAIVDAQ